MAKSEFDIPEHFRAHRPAWVIRLGRRLARTAGWTLQGEFPETTGRYVLPVAPHTSNWDFVIGMILVLALDLRANWLGKHTIFVPVVRKLWHALGGIPVDRNNPQGVLEHLHSLLQKRDTVAIAIAPEGTRKKTDHWKTGFLRLAENADAYILPLGIDNKTKSFRVFDVYETSGDYQHDLAELQNTLLQCTGIRPENM